jgi:hypothetical protein
MRKAALVLSLPVLVGIVCLLRAEPEASAMPDPQATESRSMEKFLTDRKIWGEDAFRVFAAIDRWRGEGETSILVFTDRVVGGTKFEAPEQAKERAARMALAMKRGQAKLSPEFANSYKTEMAKKTPALQVESARFLLDDSYRVQWKKDGAEFLKKELTIRAVTDAYGPPEKTSTEVVQARGDRRPAVLTISEYTGGKIKFVQSDLSPDPNLVDHVILDVAEVAKLVLAPSR